MPLTKVSYKVHSTSSWCPFTVHHTLMSPVDSKPLITSGKLLQATFVFVYLILKTWKALVPVEEQKMRMIMKEVCERQCILFI